MGVSHFLLILITSFAYIGTKAFQQLNVMHDYRKLVPLCTTIMVFCEVMIFGNIAVEAVEGDIWGLTFTIVAMSVGASSGALLSMTMHKRMRKNGGKDERVRHRSHPG
ncbi:hypothetical protein LCGC14_2277520 [marine sediment metagenome]|uniref:DUF5698 domain-containing protein n=1 Tax=marine sediment metagenome TaxID=412755 RepID=A0A0F9CVA4_9ZZZZ